MEANARPDGLWLFVMLVWCPLCSWLTFRAAAFVDRVRHGETFRAFKRWLVKGFLG